MPTRRGSSPRVRGAGNPLEWFLTLPGIIPACAGSRCLPPPPSTRWRDHPRVCGEQFIGTALVFGRLGSSPRVRGAVLQLVRVCHWVGIIPACAGSRPDLINPRTMARDHPRVCGEQLHICLVFLTGKGSSPRVRGAAFYAIFGHSATGIIPACAGSSGGHLGPDYRRRDHPRVCGEQLLTVSSLK